MALLTQVEIALENGALLYVVVEPDGLAALQIPYFVESVPVRRLTIDTVFSIPATEQTGHGQYRIKDIKTYIEDSKSTSSEINSPEIELHLIYIVEPVEPH